MPEGQEQVASLRLSIDATRAKDGSIQFKIAIDQIKAAAAGATKANEEVTASTQKTGDGFVLAGKKILSYLAVYYSFNEIVKTTLKAEAAEKALTIAIDARGAAGKASMEDLRAFASQIQLNSKYEDDEVIAQMAYAAQLGVSANQLKTFTLAAMGLAAKFPNKDLESSMMILSRLNQGLEPMLRGTTINLDKFATSEDKLNEVLRIGLSYLDAVSEQAKTGAGSLAQIKAEMNNTAEAIGAGLLPVIKEAKPEIIDFFQKVSLGANEVYMTVGFLAGGVRNFAETLQGVAQWWQNSNTFSNLSSYMSSNQSQYWDDKKEKWMNYEPETPPAGGTGMQGLRTAAGTPVPGANPSEPKEESLEDRATRNAAVLTLYKDMYSGISKTSEDYYKNAEQDDYGLLMAQIEDLNIQYEKNQRIIKDKNLLDIWYTNASDRLYQEVGEKQIRRLEKLKAINLQFYDDIYKAADFNSTAFASIDTSAYRQAYISNLDSQIAEFRRAGKTEVEIAQWKQSQIASFDLKISDEQRANLGQKNQIIVSMYSDMQDHGEGYYQNQKALLNKQYEDYAKFVADKALLDKWYANQLDRIQKENSMEWQQMKGVIGDTKGALSDFFMTFKDGDNILRTFLSSLQRVFANLAAEMVMFQALKAMGMTPGTMGVQNPSNGGFFSTLIQSGIGAIFGGTGSAGAGAGVSNAGINPNATIQPGQVNPITGMGWHSGAARVGESSGVPRLGHVLDWFGAIRLHQGTANLGPDEYRAILRRGEKVSTPEQVAREKQAAPVAAERRVLKVVNVLDPRIAKGFMQSSEGEEVVLNIIQRNKERINGL